MYCYHCGKENKDGVKFCVQCGSAFSVSAVSEETAETLSSVPEETVVFENTTSYGAADKKPFDLKNLIPIAAGVLMLIIAAVEILSVYSGLESVKPYDELAYANNRYGIFETKSCIYYNYNGNIMKISKSKKTAEKAADRKYTPVFGGDNALYCGYKNKLYKLDDKQSKAKPKKTSVSGSPSGIYSYNLNEDRLSLKLNSDKYKYSRSLNKKSYGYDLIYSPSYYNGNIYTVAEEDGDKKLVKISTKTGNARVLAEDDDLSSYLIFTKSKLVYRIDDEWYAIGYNGGNADNLDIDIDSYSVIAAGDYIFFGAEGDGNYYKYNVNNGDKTEIDIDSDLSYILLYPLHNGIAYEEDDELHILDFDGNEKYSVELD